MAWQSSGRSNDELINNLHRGGVFSDDRIATAMKKVDRKKYAVRADQPNNQTNNQIAYADSPQLIGFGATISAPHMHASAAELLLPAFEDKLNTDQTIKILDVGSGSGYFCAVMARLIGPTGRVYGVEHIKQLADQSIKNIQADDQASNQPSLMQQIEIKCGDGRLGWSEHAPFDAIHVGAAAPKLLPSLVDQLKPGGVMVCPIGPDGGHQTLELIEKKTDGTVKQKTITGVMYVPLTSQEHQLGR
jgi:protein-L-isoaspartate(D-aspartate) O-methyltransferase